MFTQNNENNLNLKIKDTLNKALVYTAFPKDTPLSFAILFDKRSSGLEVQYTTKSPLITSKQVKVRLHRDLRNCMFCRTFFNLESLEDDKHDYRCRFDSIKPMFKNTVFPFCSEILDLKTSSDNERLSSSDLYKNHNSEDYYKYITNYINIVGFKVFDFESDLIYIFVERKIFNVITRTQVIRTMGIQMTTDKGFDALCKYKEYYDKSIEKSENVNDIPSFLREDSLV